MRFLIFDPIPFAKPERGYGLTKIILGGQIVNAIYKKGVPVSTKNNGLYYYVISLSYTHQTSFKLATEDTVRHSRNQKLIAGS